MGGLSSRYGNRDEFLGQVAYIRGQPYVFERRLGSGAFGAVYASRLRNGTPVAIKMVRLDGIPPSRGAQLAKSYLNEVALLQKLRKESRHVVYIYDFDFDPSYGRAYIIMELGDGNLMSLVESLRPRDYSYGRSIDPLSIKGFWQQIVSIMYTLHSHRIVHMDLKPDNLIVFGNTVKIGDLGISKKSTVASPARLGTPFFSAPEIMQDRVGSQRHYGPEADIWSLGAILYYMVYGVPPNYSRRAYRPPAGQYATSDPLLNDVLQRTLVVNPYQRTDIVSLLRHPYTLY